MSTSITYAKRKQKGRNWPSMALLLNPVLVQAIGLTPIIVAVTTLRAALWISALSVLHLFLCEALASAALKEVPGWLRAAIYFAIGLALACPATWWLDNNDTTAAALRVFLPLMALNAVSATRCERYAVHHSVGESLRDAAANGLGFTAVALLVGAVREIFGRGSLMGWEFSKSLHMRGFWMPFGGLLLLGFLAAGLKALLRWFSARGIYSGAEAAMEMIAEDRLERLEKTRQMLKVTLPETYEEPPAEKEKLPEPKPILDEDESLFAEPAETEPKAPAVAQPPAPQVLLKDIDELLEELDNG